jgi:hypothetical protein
MGARAKSVMTWLTRSPSPAAVRPDRQATFHRYHGPGRSSSQSERVARANSGTAKVPMKSPISSATNGCPSSDPFRRWKIAQSIVRAYLGLSEVSSGRFRFRVKTDSGDRRKGAGGVLSPGDQREIPAPTTENPGRARVLRTGSRGFPAEAARGPVRDLSEERLRERRSPDNYEHDADRRQELRLGEPSGEARPDQGPGDRGH